MNIKVLCNEREHYWNCKIAFRRPFCACAHIKIDEPAFNPSCDRYIGRKEANLRVDESFNKDRKE